VASPVPLYVTAIDVEANRVVVGGAGELLGTRVLVEDVRFVQGPPVGPLPVTAKIRYRSPEAEATVLPGPDGTVELCFAEPQRAITPGQAAVFYAGDSVVGGGTIARRLPNA
jgi:tRNA-specific 2-thiouridylase